jgi:uncharacterized membrane protein YeaQ/YmgE (transglycosylase-associated protein family)
MAAAAAPVEARGKAFRLWNSAPSRTYSRDTAAGLPAPAALNRRNIMGIIMWLIIGGIVGWLASIIMRRDAQQGILLNIVVGIVGAVIGGLILGHGNINNSPLTVMSFLVSLLGAVILLAIVNLFTRRSVR